MGSDWSVSSPNPLWEMYVAVERKNPVEYAANTEVFLPDERLDLIDALAGFTCNAAYVNHLDDRTGTLEAGKLADLLIVDGDPLSDIAILEDSGRIEAVMIGGRVVVAPGRYAPHLADTATVTQRAH